MNFLLHHAFARAETGSAVAGVGAMLPDLWRMAHPRVRARASDPGLSRDEPHSALARGVEHHLAIDAWFHRTEVFRMGEHRLGVGLRSIGVPKLALFAHVGWEMCLDGAWMRRAPGLEELRTGWQGAEERVVELGDRNGAARLDPEERARFHERIQWFRDGLLEGDWASGYSTAPGVVERLEGLRTRRFGMEPMPAERRLPLAHLVRQHLDDAGAALDRLMAEREDLAAREGRPSLDWSWAR